MELEESSEILDSIRVKLRQRWELASVLNFLNVFEPVIGDDLKMSAEEIETALINPNASLAKLHVTLLKGIPPVNKNLSSPNVWVTILCKKLAEWWPWVAEGNVPLTAAKGEEISRYKELDPTIRLQMLKALCEVRIEQDDITSYISDALKEGDQLSRFRKDKIAEDGTGVSYWYDGNSFIGHRLYREVKKSHSKPRHRGKGCLDLPPTDIEWETLATNLDEFREVLEQLSSRKFGVEAVVHKFIETEVIPVLEQLQKKRERALKRKQRQEALLNGYQPYAAGVTRSCRTRRAVSYTFDEFDRTIDEALKLTRKRKDQKVQNSDGERHERRRRENETPDGDSAKDAQSCEESPASMDEDMENEHEGDGSDSEEYRENKQESEGSDNDDVENEREGEGSDNDEDVENEEKGESSDSDEDVENEEEGESSDSDEDVKNEQEGEGSDNEDMENEQEGVGSDSDVDVNSSENDVDNEDGQNNISDSSDLDLQNNKPGQRNHVKLHPKNSSGRAGRRPQVNRNPGAKNRLRQRPTRNTAIDSSIAPDSDDGSSSENPSHSVSGSGDPSVVADSQSDVSS